MAGESVTRVIEFTGPYVHDVENGFILVTISAFTWEVDGEPVEFPDGREYVGHTLRWAYAPTERPDKIAVESLRQRWNQTTRMWEDLVDVPYDHYYSNRYVRMDRTN